MPFVTDGGGREVAMMLVAYPWVILLAAGWVVGAVFVGTVGGATRGVQGFFVWTLAALLGDLVREIEIKAIHGPEELPLPPPRRQSGRFAHLAGEDE